MTQPEPISSNDPAALLATAAAPRAGGSDRFVPPRPEELAARFPEFEIIALIGSGGMGAVYRVRQVRIGRDAALKVLPPELGRQPGFAERFLREGRTLARLNHPHVVTILDFGRVDDWCWLLMELVDGANLREVLRTGPMAPAETLTVVGQLCEALQYAHEQGVVHRDIKPENILIDARGRVVIADFGLAKIVGVVESEALTGSGTALGSLHYMAPEQLERSGTVDHRADIYALGVVLYEMLTGGLPLGRFQPPSQRVPMDPRIDEVVFKALEKDPARRYRSVAEVQRDLQVQQRWEAEKRPASSLPPGRSIGWIQVVTVLSLLAFCAISWRLVNRLLAEEREFSLVADWPSLVAAVLSCSVAALAAEAHRYAVGERGEGGQWSIANPVQGRASETHLPRLTLTRYLMIKLACAAIGCVAFAAFMVLSPRVGQIQVPAIIGWAPHVLPYLVMIGVLAPTHWAVAKIQRRFLTDRPELVRSPPNVRSLICWSIVWLMMACAVHFLTNRYLESRLQDIRTGGEESRSTGKSERPSRARSFLRVLPIEAFSGETARCRLTPRPAT
jgi:serine/threonine protein kinase